MAFPLPKFSKADINRAGEILKSSSDYSAVDLEWSLDVLSNWRACHAYPINTFNTTLREKVEAVDPDAIVAQRLKRSVSILNKLNRFEKMKLSRMQDIGGLRAVISSLEGVRNLEEGFKKSRFEHELVSQKDYIREPKVDGYRSIHLVYKYKNRRNSAYDGYHLELQFRTKLQHAWATAVETMGTYLDQSLKSRQGDQDWLKFFEVTSSAFAHIEKSPLVPGYESLSMKDTFAQMGEMESKLGVLDKLSGFNSATLAISNAPKEAGRPTSYYHLVVLNLNDLKTSVTPFAREGLGAAMNLYTEMERRASDGERIEVVLVSAGMIESLRRAYPNYFLDTQAFIENVRKVIY